MSEGQRYQIVERIAAGGMAEVYRGESAGIEGFRKKVAIKRVLPKLSANREFIDMFLDEARLGAYLSHSRCVQVFDIGQGGGSHFIVMEFVDGADLKEVLEYLAAHKQAMSVEMALFITMDICEGLAYAHGACDHSGTPPRHRAPRHLAPQRADDALRRGQARRLRARARQLAPDRRGRGHRQGASSGYLAPEVTLGKGADKRVDIFAAGILLWEMLCSRRLFLGDSDLETFKQVRAAQIPDPRKFRQDLSEDLVRVLAKALAKDPNDRYPDANAFARDLSVVQQRLGRAVTYQDIGKFVQATADERAARKKTEGKSQAGFIGDLVLDALHEFSGDEIESEVDHSPLGTKGVDAGGGEFEDPTAWGLDDLMSEPLNEPPPAPAPAPAPPPAPAAAPPPPAAPVAPEAPPEATAPAPPPPPRRRAQPPTHDQEKEGPFWRRWFGS